MIVYDIETFPNVFTFAACALGQPDQVHTWEISDYRNDSEWLLATFYALARDQVPMIGFNSESFDYPIIHLLYMNPRATAWDLYCKSQQIFKAANRWEHVIWDRDRFTPQIDLFKIHHFDNKAKTTSLKALQINMRSPIVLESPLEFGSELTRHQIDTQLIPYGCNDVRETERFAQYSLPAIKFRQGMVEQFGLQVLNYNDTKIGEKMLENRLGRSVCYTEDGTRRQTPRYQIALADIIFPYIQFHTPAFQRVLEYMKGQTLSAQGEFAFDESNPNLALKTKNVFTDLIAHVGGLEFKFGTGGVHASVERQKFEATEDWLIDDIDVEGLYPNIAIVNRLAPEHLGEKFIAEYAKIPVERKQHAKGTYQNAALKLAANGAWGKSNSPFSAFYDPKYAMQIPVNGQLLICMLVEWLLTVPTLQLIQVNTDGITYRIHREMKPFALDIQKRWEQYTCLKLESANYSRMWIRDVNNYVAEDTKGKLKQKGAYWHPDPQNYADSITTASPPCWYKDLGNVASIRAAVAYMVHGRNIEAYLTDVFSADAMPMWDYMLRAKVDRSSKLMLGDRQIQRTSRYYIAREGQPLTKISPPTDGYQVGWPKKGNGVSEIDYFRVMRANGFQWDPSVCTKNKSVYSDRVTAFDSGWLAAECNDARSFSFDNVNFDYYIAEARKLII